jgi:hypothetical protein
LTQIDWRLNIIHRFGQRLQRKTFPIRTPDAAAGMPRERIVHFLGYTSVTGHSLEGVPEGMKNLAGIRYAAR